MRFTSIVPIAAAVTAVSANPLFESDSDASYGSWDEDIPVSSPAPYYEDAVKVKSSKVVSMTAVWGQYESHSSSTKPSIYYPTTSSSVSKWMSSYPTPSSTPVSPITPSTPAGYWGASYWGAASSSTPVSPVLPSSSSGWSYAADWYRRDYIHSSSASSAPLYVPTSSVSSPEWNGAWADDTEDVYKTWSSASKASKTYAPKSSSKVPAYSAPASSWAKADVAKPSSAPKYEDSMDDDMYSSDDASYEDDEDYEDSWTPTTTKPSYASSSPSTAYNEYYRRSAGYYNPANASSFATSYTKNEAIIPSSSASASYMSGSASYVAPKSSSSSWVASSSSSVSVKVSSRGYAASTAAVVMGGPLAHGTAYPTAGYYAPVSTEGSEADASLRKSRRGTANNNGKAWGKMFN